MANMLGLGVFGTFGQPYGFQQAFNADCQFIRSLDLDTSEIDMFPGTELFAVRREVVKGVYSVAFCMYTFIREMNANRNTTYLGSCIVLQGVYVEAEKIYKLLRELHTDLIENIQNVNNNTIQVRQAVNLVVREPAQFQSIKFSARSIDDTPYYTTGINAGKRYFISTEHIESSGQVVTFFDEALKNYNDSDSLYFTFSEKIINAVNKKSTLSILNWDQFIEHKNLVKEDFITSKPGLKTGPPEIIEAPVAHNYYAPPPAAPVAEPRRPEPPLPQPPPVKPDPVMSDPDFAFDGWQDPSGAWDIDEVTRRVNEYNRLLAYAKHLKTWNDDFLDQKQKAVTQSTYEPIEQPEEPEKSEEPRQKQPAWSEIPVNNTNTQRRGDDSNNDDDDGYYEPFYKRRLFIIIALIVLVVFATGGYLVEKKHVFGRQAQQTVEAADTVDTVSAARHVADTAKPPEHPVDSNAKQ